MIINSAFYSVSPRTLNIAGKMKKRSSPGMYKESVFTVSTIESHSESFHHGDQLRCSS